MRNFKNYTAIAGGFMMIMFLVLVPIGESKGPIDDGLKRLIAVTQMKAQTASDEALKGAEDQRKLVKEQELLRSPARDSTKLTAREVAREKAVLQQLEANARRSAEVLENLRRLAAEVERKPGKLDGISYLVAVTQMKAQTAGNEATRAAEKQRSLVKTSIGKAIGGAATDDNNESQQPGRLTSREIAREKAVLQQLEANARRAAEVLESVKRLAAELDRKAPR